MLALLLACVARPGADPLSTPVVDAHAAAHADAATDDTADTHTTAPTPRAALAAGPLALTGCASAPPRFVLAGGVVVGVGPADVEVDGGRIVAVGDVSADAPRVDVSGRWLVPAAIDSHVHLAYRPEGDAMAAGGVAAVVDLAAPRAFLDEDHGPLRVVAAGPMITASGGYPTQGWGRGGYGLEVTTAEEAAAAVESLHAAGARVVKIPLDSGPALSDEALAAAVARSHALDVPVAVHALGDDDAALGASSGTDLLAHTPVAPLSDATVDAWSGRAVVSTLGAFGGGDDTLANLAALRAAGATVLYGTDFGNTRTAGIDARELALLAEAGLAPADVLAAVTSAPAAFWGLDDLGSIAPGKAASILALPTDPLVDPLALASPDAVWLDGVRMR